MKLFPNPPQRLLYLGMTSQELFHSVDGSTEPCFSCSFRCCIGRGQRRSCCFSRRFSRRFSQPVSRRSPCRGFKLYRNPVISGWHFQIASGGHGSSPNPFVHSWRGLSREISSAESAAVLVRIIVWYVSYWHSYWRSCWCFCRRCYLPFYWQSR